MMLNNDPALERDWKELKNQLWCIVMNAKTRKDEMRFRLGYAGSELHRSRTSGVMIFRGMNAFIGSSSAEFNQPCIVYLGNSPEIPLLKLREVQHAYPYGAYLYWISE
jgi:hypothetical protein